MPVAVAVGLIRVLAARGVVAVVVLEPLVPPTLVLAQPTLVAVGVVVTIMLGLRERQRLAVPALWSSNGGSSNGALCRT
jgi:hypothetical protein